MEGVYKASYVVDPNPDKLSDLQDQVDDVSGIMRQNIDKVLERGEKLDDLIVKTDDLQATLSGFKSNTGRLSPNNQEGRKGQIESKYGPVSLTSVVRK
ncbi:synaptobrevin homolog 1 isoform X2 [Callorhinchus milii]|uniref:synaptobrevin homolog 1 isoform X2 n=1 Tax=Callorhinchus milii TaxID=7868 RepID=UPI001C3F5B86|nr:synaptobrevin homolog 1 isoform X2 [Callorhinchus milii]